ncbi:NAD(P)-binding protein [Auriscalpium vulgare]|uniref:NAD(P)-binding protein n=1 Tax=Auriscalpium vulgare TaxID=40419 RepID=A0ACB8S7Q3_9AGAM|nr:NAD(P)-binding protein [Auriscalpium vulgare]
MVQKVVICGAGFLGRNIAAAIARGSSFPGPPRSVQVSSRKPDRLHALLSRELPAGAVLAPAVAADITKPDTLVPAFKDASVVISLVGLLQGSPAQFEAIQWRGAENVAKAARAVGAKLIHISAIGADPDSNIAYWRTKALGEEAAFEACPEATVIRPSLVFGPGDSFFNRFARLSQILPVLPVFGDGGTRFQPVYVGDIARLTEVISRNDQTIRKAVAGRIIEAGGPDIFTFKEIMELVLKYTHRYRPIVPVPWFVGKMQGAVLERLPSNILTLTRDQVEQLRHDNILSSPQPETHVSFEKLMFDHGERLRSVHEVLPEYL